jgi:hypothetical protein
MTRPISSNSNTKANDEILALEQQASADSLTLKKILSVVLTGTTGLFGYLAMGNFYLIPCTGISLCLTAYFIKDVICNALNNNKHKTDKDKNPDDYLDQEPILHPTDDDLISRAAGFKP